MYFPFVKAACLLFVLTLSHTPVLLGNGEVRRLLRAEVQLKNAKVYLRTGQPEKGLMLLNRSLVANPDSPESWYTCLLYTSPSPRDATLSRMPSSA